MSSEAQRFGQTGFSLAPSGLVRAAAWPLRNLDGFGDPELSRMPLSATRYADAYRQVLAREREHMWTWFRDDSQFERALCLASLSARSRIRIAAERRDGARNHSMRQAEQSLYRYQARAAGRSTPNGLWSGVTTLGLGTRTRIDSAAPGYLFTPHLRPFQSLLRALGQRPDYRRRSLWRLNPTLTLGADGHWEFLQRSPRGEVRRGVFDDEPKLRQLLAMLAGMPPLSLDALAAELAGRDVWSLGARRGLLHLLTRFGDSGVLVGGLDLSESFASVWQALEQSAERLPADDRRAWRNTQSRLQDLCADLGHDLEQRSVESLVATLRKASDEVAGLHRRLQLNDAEVPPQVLRCDRRLAWRLTLGTATTARLATALAEYQSCWLEHLSPAAAYRQLARRQLQDSLGADGLALLPALDRLINHTTRPPQIWPAGEHVGDPSLRDRLHRWADCIGSAAAVTTLRPGPASPTQSPPQAPLGCMFLGLDDGPSLNPRSVSDIATLASSRFASLVDCAASHEWLRARLCEYAERSGRRVAELRLPFETNPNVLAAAALVETHFLPWGAMASQALYGARLRAGAGAGVIELQLPKDDTRWIVIKLDAADQQTQDPLAQLLLMTGYHESPGRSQRAIDVPTTTELRHGRSTPEIRLPSGARLRQRRTLVSEPLPSLLGRGGIDRFRLWQNLAREHAWPERLQVAFADGEGLRIHRDSPLAIEALFKGVRADCPWMAVTSAESDTGFSVPGVGPCVIELAQPFARADDANANA